MELHCGVNYVNAEKKEANEEIQRKYSTAYGKAYSRRSYNKNGHLRMKMTLLCDR